MSMNMNALFNQSPECIRNKINVYLLGFGTPVANLVISQIKLLNEIKKVSSDACMDDYSLWRWKIAKTQSGVMRIDRPSFTGYVALCELTIAYNASHLCHEADSVKSVRIFRCNQAIQSYGIIPSMI